VSLSWTAVAGATAYNVKRSTTSGGPYTQVASTVSPSHVDGTVTNGTQYFYVVTATNAGGESGNSNQAAATPVAPGPPTWTMSGVVRNNVTLQPIPGATVLVVDGPNANRSATANSSGAYSLAGLIQSGFTVRISAPGYRTTEGPITLTTNITADFLLPPVSGGATGSFTGTWRGFSRSTSCSADGVYSGFCDANPTLALAPFELRLTQTGTSVVGTVNDGGLVANLSGTATGNRLELTGSGTRDRVNWDFEGWNTTMSGDRMTGTYALRLTSQEGTGNGRVRYTMELVSVTRVSNSPTAAPTHIQERQFSLSR
jgi:fibronectin type 3 domain-containing protein